MNNLGEQVVVNQEVPHFLPEFKNPIYEAVMARKEVLRAEVIKRIKCGDFSDGLAPLFRTIGGITQDEYVDIISYWFNNGRKDLFANYRRALFFNDVDCLAQVDRFLQESNLNNSEGNGRK